MRLSSASFDTPLFRIALPGALLLLVGMLLLGFTAYADRLRALGEDALGGFVLTGKAATPGPGADGRLVLVTGMPVVKTPARDAQFGVTAPAPALIRKVEMFQWNETRFGEIGYEQDWYDHPIDSTTFREAAAHANPGAFPIAGARFDSSDTTLGGFRLDSALIDMIPGADEYTPSLAGLPPNMAATFSARDGTLVSSVNVASPQIGDLRISWRQVQPGELTVFAEDRRGTLVPVRNAAGDPIAQVLLGDIPLNDAVLGAPHSPRFVWMRRLLSLLLAWAGVAMLLSLRQRRDYVLALAMAVVPLATIAAVAWFGVRMSVFATMVLLLVFAVASAAWRWRNRSGGA